MEVVLDNVENFAQFWVYLVQEILVVLITTSLLALFAYIFRKRIKRFLNKKDLLPADKVPNLRLEFEDISYRTDYQKKMYTLQIENIGAGSVSDIELFLYENGRKASSDLMRIEPVKYTVGYKDAKNNSGERIVIDFVVNDKTEYDGFFLQFSHESGVLFCTKVYLQNVYSEELNRFYIDIIPQGIVRIKRSLPRRNIEKSSTYLADKYGVDVSLG